MGATRFAVVALLGVAAALAAPSAGFAQDFDPAALQAEVESAIDAGMDAGVDAGGVSAPPPTPIPAPEPISEPDAIPEPEAVSEVGAIPEPVAIPEPDSELLSETADAPAPESPAPPSEPAVPMNINVDIRIFSPGDDGDVTQVIDMGMPTVPGGMPGSGPGGAPADDSGFTWNWEWNWDTACGPDAMASTARTTWNWTWDWGCGSPAPGSDMPMLDFVDSQMQSMLELAPEEASLLGEEILEVLDGGETASPPPAEDPRPRATRTAPEPSREAAAPSHELFTIAAGGNVGQATDAAKPAARATDGRRGSENGSDRESHQTPSGPPSVAASAVSGGGGSSVPFGAALLGLLCLFAPRAHQLAHTPYRKLSSLLSSSRLERPG